MGCGLCAKKLLSQLHATQYLYIVLARTELMYEYEYILGEMHGKMNFFVIIFDRLNFSKTKD